MILRNNLFFHGSPKWRIIDYLNHSKIYSQHTRRLHSYTLGIRAWREKIKVSFTLALFLCRGREGGQGLHKQTLFHVGSQWPRLRRALRIRYVKSVARAVYGVNPIRHPVPPQKEKGRYKPTLILLGIIIRKQLLLPVRSSHEVHPVPKQAVHLRQDIQ